MISVFLNDVVSDFCLIVNTCHFRIDCVQWLELCEDAIISVHWNQSVEITFKLWFGNDYHIIVWSILGVVNQRLIVFYCLDIVNKSCHIVVGFQQLKCIFSLFSSFCTDFDSNWLIISYIVVCWDIDYGCKCHICNGMAFIETCREDTWSLSRISSLAIINIFILIKIGYRICVVRAYRLFGEDFPFSFNLYQFAEFEFHIRSLISGREQELWSTVRHHRIAQNCRLHRFRKFYQNIPIVINYLRWVEIIGFCDFLSIEGHRSHNTNCKE